MSGEMETAATQAIQETPTTTAAEGLPQSVDNGAENGANSIPETNNAPKTKAAKGKDTTEKSVAGDEKQAGETKTEGEAPVEVDYSFKPPEGFVERIGENDAILGIACEVAKELGFDASQMENARNLITGIIGKMADSGILQDAVFDPVAEMAKLGADGETRADGLRTHIAALVERNEIPAEDAAFLNSLTVEAAGVKLLEDYFKGKGVTDFNDPEIDPNNEKSKNRFKQLVTDDRYGKDTKFTRDADMEIARDNLAAD